MTPKEKYIHNLHQARTAHIRWVNAIKLLVSGIDVDLQQISLDAVGSSFGQWYYNEGMLFSQGISRLVIEEIEKHFIGCHDHYTKIYSIFFNKKRSSIIGELFGKQSRVNAHEMELAHRYYEEIVILSDQLKNKLRVFEAQLMSFTDDKFLTYGAVMDEKSTLPINNTHTEPNKESDGDDKAYFYGARGRG